MVAYSFAPRFADPVAAGTKRQTIRGPRRRHARPGEPIQLYAGMRTRHCRKLVVPDPVVVSVERIRLFFPPQIGGCLYEFPDKPQHSLWAINVDFARDDGFDDEKDFSAWWRDTHGVGTFEGVLIRWVPRYA